MRQCWNETSAQVKARLDELEKMMTATDELKTLERELDRWLSRAESNLADAISNTQDVNERKRMIQVFFLSPHSCNFLVIYVYSSFLHS